MSECEWGIEAEWAYDDDVPATEATAVVYDGVNHLLFGQDVVWGWVWKLGPTGSVWFVPGEVT